MKLLIKHTSSTRMDKLLRDPSKNLTKNNVFWVKIDKELKAGAVRYEVEPIYEKQRTTAAENKLRVYCGLKKRTWFHQLLFYFYKVCKAIFVSIYFYYFTLSLLFITFLVPFYH